MTILGHINSIYVTDQERAKQFYTEVLGYETVRDDQLNERFRFLSVCPPGNHSLEIALFSCDDAGVGVDHDTGQRMFELVQSSAFSAGVIRTDDCYAYCDRLREHGVRFQLEPEMKDWGVIEAIILDDSGNRLSIVSTMKKDNQGDVAE